MPLQRVPDSDGSVEPSENQPIQSARSYAIQFIGTLLSESPLAHDQFREARHDQSVADQLAAEADQASQQRTDAETRAAAERRKANPDERINRPLGTTLAITLALLDALPAYWTAEAFGLSQTSTIIVTVLLCAALGGGMWLLELFSRQHRRSALRILGAALAAGFLAMFGLRQNYLEVTGGQGFMSSALESLALTAMSAALVCVGFVILSHRTTKAVTSAEQVARETARSGAAKAAASARAKAVMSRAAFKDTVVTAGVSREHLGISHEQFLEAIGDAIDSVLSR